MDVVVGQALKRRLALSLLVCAAAGAVGALEQPPPRRVALVLGSGPAEGLAGSRAVAQALRDAGFDQVLREENATRRGLARAVDTLAAQGPAELALLYYAGPVLESDGENYLLASDSAITSKADVPYEGYAAQRVLAKMREAGAPARVLVLDAGPHPLGAGAGLAPIGASPGELVAISVAPGKAPVADAAFGRELVSALRQPGLSLSALFGRVRDRVAAGSKGTQVPHLQDALNEAVVLAPARPAPPASAVPAPPSTVAAAAAPAPSTLAPVPPTAPAPRATPVPTPPSTTAAVPPSTLAPPTASAPRPVARPAASVAGRVEVLDKGGQRATDTSDAVVWIDDVKGKPARPSKATITMRGKAFTPHVVVVPVGGTVEFPNDDPILHNVFSVAGENRFDLDLYKRPRSGTWTAKVPGVVRVYCNIHPQMGAVVVVRDGPHFAKVNADGSFLLEGVPPGKHVLKGWHERGGEASVEVMVPAEGSVTAELKLDAAGFKREPHKNKFGKDYGTGEKY